MALVARLWQAGRDPVLAAAQQQTLNTQTCLISVKWTVTVVSACCSPPSVATKARTGRQTTLLGTRLGVLALPGRRTAAAWRCAPRCAGRSIIKAQMGWSGPSGRVDNFEWHASSSAVSSACMRCEGVSIG